MLLDGSSSSIIYGSSEISKEIESKYLLCDVCNTKGNKETQSNAAEQDKLSVWYSSASPLALGSSLGQRVRLKAAFTQGITTAGEPTVRCEVRGAVQAGLHSYRTGRSSLLASHKLKAQKDPLNLRTGISPPPSQESCSLYCLKAEHRTPCPPSPLPSGPLGLCTSTLHEGCLRKRLQMKGMTMSRASGGAVRASRERRFINAATRYAGR